MFPMASCLCRPVAAVVVFIIFMVVVAYPPCPGAESLFFVASGANYIADHSENA